MSIYREPMGKLIRYSCRGADFYSRVDCANGDPIYISTAPTPKFVVIKNSNMGIMGKKLLSLNEPHVFVLSLLLLANMMANQQEIESWNDLKAGFRWSVPAELQIFCYLGTYTEVALRARSADDFEKYLLDVQYTYTHQNPVLLIPELMIKVSQTIKAEVETPPVPPRKNINDIKNNQRAFELTKVLVDILQLCVNADDNNFNFNVYVNSFLANAQNHVTLYAEEHGNQLFSDSAEDLLKDIRQFIFNDIKLFRQGMPEYKPDPRIDPLVELLLVDYTEKVDEMIVSHLSKLMKESKIAVNLKS